MADLLRVLAVSGNTSQQEEKSDNHNVCYLTLTDVNGQSENRYYVSLAGQDANVDWQEDDRIMVELAFLAYRNQGQWYMSHRSDTMKVIDINCKQV